MAGDFDDVNSPDFQEALNNAGRATASSAKTYEVINKLKGLYNRTGALAQLMLENPDMFNRLKKEYPSAFDYASAEGAAQYAEYTYEQIRKAHPGQTPEDKIERIREVRALADNDNVDSQHAELVQVLANARGDRDTVDRKKVEKTIKLYDQWIRDAKSNPVVYRNYQQPAQRSAYIRGELDKLKKDRELYAAVVSSVTHGDIKASDELKSIVKEHSGAGRPQQKTAARSSVELTDLSSDALYDLYKKNLIIINGKTFEDIKKDLKNFDKLAQEAVDTIKNHPEKCKEVRPIKLSDLSKTELARLAQNGKVKVTTYTDKDGKKKWSYHALTPEEKAKGDKYWIEHNKKQRPELFGLTREQVNAGNDNKPAESRSAGGNSGNAGSAESRGNLTISDNMKYALNMGPTVLKEELEAMGYKFDASMIRHGANGNEYIPTSKLKAWMQSQEFTADQISQLNALVDDRAAFDAKVKEINNRDSYVASAPARDNTAAATGAAAAPAEEVAEQPAEKSGADKLKDDLATLAATNGAAYNGMMAAFQALRSNDDSQIPDQMMQILINMMKQYGYTDMCQMANDGLDAMKVDDKTRAGNDGVDMAATATAKTRPDATKPKDPQHVADLEAARKLLKEDPKKFKTAKEAYSKAAASGDKRAAELLAAMNEVDKDSKEALKQQAKTDKENADQAQQEVKEEHQKKSLKKALKNRATDVSKFFKKTFGIKTKKDKEKEAALAAEQQKAQQQADALANRKITLEHDKDGNAVYTLSGYGRFDGGDHNGLYDGKYTVYQSENASAVKFAANDGAQFTDFVQGGQQLPVVQALKDEMTARSAEQAQVAARMAQQKTNS